MADYPAMPLWTDAYLGDTTHLTTIEHGAYLLLLMTMWRAGGSLEFDDKLLARYARLNAGQWRRIKPVLMPFFTVEEGRIKQGRLTAEYGFVKRKAKSQSARAKARWLKNNETSDATASAGQCHGNAPTPTPTPTIKEVDANASTPPDKPPDECRLAMDAYNVVATRAGLPKAQRLSDQRRRSLTARLRECGGLDGWNDALAKLEASDFCTGRRTAWRADIDFLCQAKTFTKLIEGSYDNHANDSPPAGKPQPGGKPDRYDTDRLNRGIAAALVATGMDRGHPPPGQQGPDHGGTDPAGGRAGPMPTGDPGGYDVEGVVRFPHAGQLGAGGAGVR